MYFGILILVGSLIMESSDAVAIRPQPKLPDTPGFKSFYALQSRGAILPSGAVIPLTRHKGGSKPLRRRNDIARAAAAPANSTASNDIGLTAALKGQNLLAEVSIGDQPFKLLVDTGSSDTWVPANDFNCLDQNERQLDQAACKFGNLYTQGKNVSVVPDVQMGQTYTSGEFMRGPMLLEKVTMGGITVPKSQIAAVNNAFWNGDGLNSGLLGLSSVATTTAFTADDKQKPYNPVFTNMIEQNLTQPFFSIAIDNVSEGRAGFLTLGGLPPVAHEAEFTTLPIEQKSERFGEPIAQKQIVDFFVKVPSFTVAGNQVQTAGLEMIVDSGTAANVVPDDLADNINTHWTPAATFNNDKGLFQVDCAATAPDVGITLGNKTFLMNASVSMLEQDQDCFSGWAGGGNIGPNSTFFLGDVFMKTVVSVFDLGTAEMHFAARQ